MPLVKKYKVEVVCVDCLIEDVYTVSFKSNTRFKYLPGQFLHLALDEFDGSGQWPESRCFSMQSNPNEEFITITYSVKGKFTRRMQSELKNGKELWLKLPYGDIFQKKHSKENCIFIAGGTGIAPFLSLFNDISFGRYTTPQLHYGFRDKAHRLFISEIERVHTVNPTLQVMYYDLSRNEIIKIADIAKENPNSFFFLSGPPKMIETFRNTLLSLGIMASSIISDDWY